MPKTARPRAFHIMAKPAGARCNGRCDDCFYLDKQGLYPGSDFRMSDEVLRLLVGHLLEAHPGPEVPIARQGGEPTPGSAAAVKPAGLPSGFPLEENRNMSDKTAGGKGLAEDSASPRVISPSFAFSKGCAGTRSAWPSRGQRSMNMYKKWLLVLAVILAAVQAAAQTAPAPEFKPAIIEQPMPDFRLPSFQGGEVTLSALKGKNVMIIFPRGYAAPNYWCTICNYKYVELALLEKEQRLREKYNVEVLVVFPYGREVVKSWLEALPSQLETIKAAKYPSDPAKLDEAGQRKMVRWRAFFPQDFALQKGEVLAPFPVLIDADRAVSKALGLFQTEWTGGKVDQNIPSVFIVDKAGVLRFKYIAQNTVDRPSHEYLFKVLEFINAQD